MKWEARENPLDIPVVDDEKLPPVGDIEQVTEASTSAALRENIRNLVGVETRAPFDHSSPELRKTELAIIYLLLGGEARKDTRADCE